MGVLSRRIAAIAAAATVLAAPLAARAADMSLMAPPMTGPMSGPPVEDGPVTFATGWYLRGDFGVSGDVQVNLGSVTLPSKNGYPNTWSIGLGAGYKFNDWIRADVTLDWRAPRAFSGNTTALACPSVVTKGVVMNTQPCFDWVQARLTNTTTLFNVYGDLGTWYGVTPYVGAGIGFNYVYQKAAQSWFLGNGLPAKYTLPDTDPLYPIYYVNMNQARTVSSLQLAWALMGGVSYAMTPNLAVDVGARYLHLGTIQSMWTTNGLSQVRTNTAKELRIGFRYTPD